MISVEHSHAEGTVVHGTARGDGTNLVIKATNGGWRFSRNIGTGAWYLPQSRDRTADQPRITRLAEALTAAGYEVTVQVDDTRRTPAAIEADRASTVAGRVERYTTLAEARLTESTARLDKVQERRSHIPLGQPVIGARDASYRARLNRAEDIGREHIATGEHWQHRANAAEVTQRYRHNPRVISRRIERLDADLRRWHRSLADVRTSNPTTEATAAYVARAEQEIAVLRDEVDYWRNELLALQARGIWRPWAPEHFRPGDEVQISATWYPVIRVNRKTLTVPPLIFAGDRHLDAHGADTWTDTAPYDKVYGRRRNGKILHYPPPPPDATCTEPAAAFTPRTGSDGESAVHPCSGAPVARVIIRHDGTTCGCTERCLVNHTADAAAPDEQWIETMLLCADHAECYQHKHASTAATPAVTYEDLT